MANLPKVDIQFQNAQLGRIDDPGAGIPGMLVCMASAPTGHAYGDAIAYSTFQALPIELQQIEAVKLFFAEAPGYKVYIMPVPLTSDVQDILNPLNVSPYAADLINADDAISFIGVVNKVVALLDIEEAGTNAKALRAAFEPLYRYVRTFFGVEYAATLPDLTSADYTGTGVVVSPSANHVGLLLARRAKIRVQRSIGRVKDGALIIANAELITGTPLADSMTEVDEIYGKSYISLRVYVGKSGYYFTGDKMAVPSTDDYAFDANRAVIDKAARLAYERYVDQINDDIELDADGSIETTVAKELQGQIENDINAVMTANGEISAVSAFIDATQNMTTGDKLEVVLGITPKGYLREIVVKLGFQVTN